MQGTGHRTQVATWVETLPKLRSILSPPLSFQSCQYAAQIRTLLCKVIPGFLLSGNNFAPMKEELMKSGWMNHHGTMDANSVSVAGWQHAK